MIEPKLRFKAFSDELSHHTLMDIIVEKPSNGIMNRQSDKVTAVKHINVIDMYTDDKIHIDELSYSEYGDTAVEKCNVEIGDIFLTRSSVKADGIAKSNILLDDGIYVYDDHLIRLKVDKNNYIPEFVNDYLASPRFRRQFIVRAKTTAFTTIGQGDVASCTGDFPSLPEQQKIAEFLSTIDTVIAKQKETVSAWEERKKGVMQKLFNQEVRFKADDGSEFPDWEKKKLEDVVEFLDGQRKPLEAGQRVSGKYPYYGASGIIDYVEDYIFDEELILLSEDGANILDRNYRVCFLAKGKYWVNNHAHVLRAMDGNVNGFICEQLESFDYRKYNSGGAQPKLNQATCRSIIMNIPCLAEQQKIADCLSSLDEIIEKQKATLVAWEELKKGLLQQMFV